MLIVEWPQWGGSRSRSPGPCVHVSGRCAGIAPAAPSEAPWACALALSAAHSTEAAPVMPECRGGVSIHLRVPCMHAMHMRGCTCPWTCTGCRGGVGVPLLDAEELHVVDESMR